MTERMSARVLQGHNTRLKTENEGLKAHLAEVERTMTDLVREKEALGRALHSTAQERDEARASRSAEAKRAMGLEVDNRELKERLHHSEMERARLDGYIARVADDDQAREGPVEIQETRRVPRRDRPLSTVAYGGPIGGAMSDACNSDRSRPRHWTAY